VRALGAKFCVMVGLALKFCVTASAIDTQKMGIKCFVVLDGCRAIEFHQNPTEMAKIIKELTDAGVTVVQKITDLRKFPELFGEPEQEDKSSSSSNAAAGGGSAANTA